MTKTYISFAKIDAAREVHPLFNGPIPGKIAARKVTPPRTATCPVCFNAISLTGACFC